MNSSEKYNTYIEQGGTNVSGGQRQRLCIARALLKKPKILILDDSTSAVDTATDARIRESFAEKIPNTTKIIIAQRISSVQHADHILVLEDGCVNGYGTHEELLKSNAIYADVYESQTNGSGDFDSAAADAISSAAPTSEAAGRAGAKQDTVQSTNAERKPTAETALQQSFDEGKGGEQE